MPPYRGRRKSDGAVLTVEAPADATPTQIIELAKTKGVVEPKAKVIEPTMSGYLGQGLKNRAGDIGAMIGGTVMPGSGLLGFAGRLGAAELGQDVGDAATG